MEDVIKSLINGLQYSQERIAYIRFRLNEIMRDYNLTLEQLSYYCTADSCEMFSVIFDYKEFNSKNFVVD